MAYARSYIVLALNALVVVVIAASLWPYIADTYNDLVASGANMIAPAEATVSAAYGRIHMDMTMGSSTTVHGYVLHFGLILVTALVAATPGLSITRIVILLPAAVSLFILLHIAGVALFAWGMSTAVVDGSDVITVGRAFTAFAIFWGLVPALIAGAWCYRYWRPIFQRA